MRRVAYAAAAALLALALPAGPAAATPGPSDAPEYWFDDWHVTTLWDKGYRGQGITIAEIDTGVNASLPALRGRVAKGTDLGRGGDGRTDRDRDAFGHGTAMASIMVARPSLFSITGLAPGARILPVAVPLNGTTDSGLPDDLPGAIDFAADHGAKIISMSLGGKRTPDNDPSPCPADEQAAIFHALRKGAVVVASVGNTGPAKNTVEDPGACLGVMSVGAVDIRGHVAGFSAREPYLTLAAPGVDVPSLGRVPGQAYSGRGTSQAAAVVAAALALVWSAFPHAAAPVILTRVLATLDDRHARPSRSYGYGIVNPYAAITAHVPAGATDPVSTLAAPFLARDAAFAKAGLGRAPPPAGRRGDPAGHQGVGSVPRLLTARVLTGLALALAGLVLLVAVGVLGVRGRRRRVVDVALPPWEQPPVGAPPYPPPPPPPPLPPSPLAPHAGAALGAPPPEHPRPRPRPGPGAPTT